MIGSKSHEAMCLGCGRRYVARDLRVRRCDACRFDPPSKRPKPQPQISARYAISLDCERLEIDFSHCPLAIWLRERAARPRDSDAA